MAKHPGRPEEIFEEYTRDWQTAFPGSVEAIVLFGSAASGQYIPGKSDINFLVELQDEAIKHLSQAIPLVQKWLKRRVAVPLVLTEKYIQSSLDTFPIEFLSFKLNHKVVYGRDPFAHLDIKKRFVRLQLERELKGKLLHLRENFLALGENRKELRRFMGHSLKAFFPLFEALLYLKDQDIPGDKTELAAAAMRLVDPQDGSFGDVVKLYHSDEKLSLPELLVRMQSYINSIQKMVYYVDGLQVE